VINISTAESRPAAGDICESAKMANTQSQKKVIFGISLRLGNFRTFATMSKVGAVQKSRRETTNQVWKAENFSLGRESSVKVKRHKKY
jgi:hypothetical protein